MSTHYHTSILTASRVSVDEVNKILQDLDDAIEAKIQNFDPTVSLEIPGRYNTPRLVMGGFHIYIGSSNHIYINNGAPTTDNQGFTVTRH